MVKLGMGTIGKHSEMLFSLGDQRLAPKVIYICHADIDKKFKIP